MQRKYRQRAAKMWQGKSQLTQRTAKIIERSAAVQVWRGRAKKGWGATSCEAKT